MTTNFPSSIDAFTNPTSADTLDNPPHDQQHADINDAMEAVQAKLGVDGSAVSSSLDYRVAALEQVSGRRNLLYNGAMQVAQRGTSATGLTGFSYNTADRWALGLNSVGTYTQSNENDAPAGFSSSLKLTCTTADASLSSGDYGLLYQPLEGQDLQHLKKGTASAESLTLSFWVKSNVTGTYISDLLDQDNSRSISASYSINSSGVWEYKTMTFEGDVSGFLDNDNGSSFQLRFWLAAGSVFSSGTLQTSWGTGSNIATGQTNLSSAVNNYWQITGVQLEVGDKATPFEHRSFGEELALCQRYYYVLPRTTDIYCDMLSGGTVDNASFARYPMFRPKMRTQSPTLVSSIASLFANLNASGHQVGTAISYTNGAINLSSSSMSTNQATMFRANASSTCFVALSTEL